MRKERKKYTVIQGAVGTISLFSSLIFFLWKSEKEVKNGMVSEVYHLFYGRGKKGEK